MKRWIKIAIWTILLAVGVVICAVRWQAWFGMPDEPEWTGDTISYVFPTFERDTTLHSFDILVLGDIHNGLNRSQYDTLAARVPQADVVAQVGDWVDRGYFYYHQLLLREWTNSDLYGMPVIACPGNHEYSKGLRKTLSPFWRDAFTYPHNSPIGVPGVSYYIDLPGVRMIALDTNPLNRLMYLTRTLTWIRQAMKDAGKRYVVVIMHHPVHSARKGRHNALIHAAFFHVLNDADLVISGHDHSYMRRMPYVVLNTSGRPKKQKDHIANDSTLISSPESVYGVISVPYSDKPLEWHVYRLDDGMPIDSVYVNHH